MRRATAGFTLIEVIVALGILGSALFVLLRFHYGTMQLHGELRDEITTRTLLEQALGIAEVELTAGNATGSDEFGKRYPDYEYSFEGQAVDLDQYPGLYQVQVIVTGPDDIKEEMDTYMFIPSYE
ncbi:MAG: prepilin-type N-terminal cleavage/methylation domain-containing protein [Candidatus Hydrogenedentes bacterium]|nr:prepilin-type N-terminal cleavage/methylation domain-containing protein [Candidatus Hydrogenedentota bacterium]